MSTVYSNCTSVNKHVSEEFYPVAYNYKDLFELVEREPDESVRKITKSFIYPWPNTYSFTKQIAEDIISKEGRELPIGIFRPGISKENKMKIFLVFFFWGGKIKVVFYT